MSHRNSSSTQQACAACKYQRRKCAPDCILAPYFPHDRQQQFIHAHKLFGVSNITKIIKNLEPHAQYEAMQTIIFQSDARAYDPVGGCFRIIRELERQIESVSAEYRFVCQQLAIYRAQEQQQSQTQLHQSSNDVVPPHYGALYYQQQQEEEDHSQTNGNHQFVVQPNDPQEQYMRIMEENGHQDHVDNDDNLQDDDPNAWVMHDPTLSLLNIKDQFVNDCDDGDDVRNHDDADELKPMSNHYERNHLIFEDQKTIQLSDRNGFINEEKQVIPKEDNAVFKQEQEQHDFEVAAANLFPLTSCISS